MEEFIEKLPDEHNIGWVPDELKELMADAALNVILAVNATNVFIDKET